MPTNARKQTKRLPFKLEIDGLEYGCYKDVPVGLIKWLRENNKAYALFHMDNKIDEN